MAGENRYRVGTGYDVHRFGNKPAETIRLGGVDVPCQKPLLAHSDGDVLLHAIMDALLGAAGLGDIGECFPDSDPAYKGADSTKLLERVGKMLQEKGYTPANIDATLIGEEPKISPYKRDMERTIAKALDIPAEWVNVKATTTEGLGFTGRREGLAAQAVCAIAAMETD